MTWTRRDLLTGAGCMALAAGMPRVASAAVRVCDGPAFGTYWRATLPTDTDTAAVRAAIEAVVTTVDDAMSPYRESAEISRFNRDASTDWFPLSAHSAAVAAEGLRIAALTGGAFDPTVGGIVGRYGFGPIRSTTPATYEDLAVRPGALKKAKAGVTFDPCGIGEGYALDLMVAALDQLGVRSFLIEVGGEVFARGNHPDGRPWQVGIERPGQTPLSFQRIVRIDGMAMATSGDSANSYDLGGRRVSHIIDPRRGEPVGGSLAAVSVIAPTGMTADALSTALFVMGPKSGSAFAYRNGLAALFLFRRGDGLAEVRTPALEPYILA